MPQERRPIDAAGKGTKNPSIHKALMVRKALIKHCNGYIYRGVKLKSIGKGSLDLSLWQQGIISLA